MTVRFLWTLGVASAVLGVSGCNKPGGGDHSGHDHGGHADGEDEHGAKGDHEDHDEHGDHDEGTSGRVVKISMEAVTRMGITVAKVSAAPAVGGVQAPAEIQADPDLEADVSSIVSGQLAKVTASVGDVVKAGQTLAIVRSIALGEARADVARAQANIEVARSTLARQEELKREGIGATRKLLEAQAAVSRFEAQQVAAQRALEVYGRGGSGSSVPIKSPINGRVLTRNATVGAVIDPSDMLFKITDIKRVWAVGRVYQQHATQVLEGAEVTLTLQAVAGRTFRGTLDYVAPALDERTRTLPVRMVLDNAEGILLPGFFGTLSISPAGSAAAEVPAVDADAVQGLGDEVVVFVPGDEEGEFRAVSVSVASRGRGLALLRTGLQVGDRYVSKGAFVLKSELSRGDLGEGHVH